EINRNKFVSNPPEIAAELRKVLDVAEEERKWSDELALWQARWHMQDWLDCVRSRNRPVADVEIGHRSVTVCHLANITRAVGRATTASGGGRAQPRGCGRRRKRGTSSVLAAGSARY